ncbi:MAG: bifunctional 5,10-methylenetetrahydrofolate dehydrogenase/5,10-methenyltetrahydrofolate cyclohydrolase, partial [Bryobacteraceae bacterium]
MAQILDGAVVRDKIFSDLKPRVQKLSRPPGLAVVLVGENPASEIYVRNKIKACADLGIYSEKICPPSTITTDELLAVIEGLNVDPAIDGILVQMPLPRQVDSRRVLEAVAAEKDADGFHPLNVGHLVAGRPGPRACTPAGVIELLKFYHIKMDGRRAVVLGRSDIVGKPMALMLLQENATVTVCHSATTNLMEECRRADILVAAMGKPAFLTSEFIAPGATVIDV